MRAFGGGGDSTTLASRRMLREMALSDRIQKALAAASELTREEREVLLAELVLSLEYEAPPAEGYDEAWATEIRRRVDRVVNGTSDGAAWPQVRREIAAELARRRRLTA